MTWFVYAIISAFLASLSAVIEKRTLSDMHSVDFTSFQAVIAALITLPFLFNQSAWEIVTVKVILVCILVSILGTIAMIDVTRGVRHMEISESAPLFLLNPMFTTLLAFLFLGESLSSFQVFGILLLAFGTYILETTRLRDFKEFWRHLTGNHYARLVILGMLLYSCTALLDRISVGHWDVDPLFYVALVQVFLAINFTLFYFIHRKKSGSSPTQLLKNWKPVLLVAFLTSGHRIMFSQAAALAAIGLVSATKRSSSLFTTVIGGELFHEKDLFRKSIACTIMIVGVALIALK